MNEELLSFLEALKTNRRLEVFDEASTKQAIIVRIFSLMGWDIFDIDEVTPEFAVGTKRVDYALRSNNLNKVFIEVKKVGEELEKHQEQLLNYSFKQGVKLAILTNGIVWWFYLPLHEGSWEQRKFYSIDIQQQESEDIGDKFNDYLLKEKVLSGVAIRNAEAIYKGKQKTKIITDTLPKAWNQIVSEVDEILVDLLSETTESICGFKPDSQSIEKFLEKNQRYLLVKEGNGLKSFTSSKWNRAERTIKNKVRKTENRQFNYTGLRVKYFVLLGERYEGTSWREMLISICGFMAQNHKRDFEKVLQIHGRRRPYFTLNNNELRKPLQIAGTKIFFESNLSSNRVVKLIYQLLELFGYEDSDLKIEAGPR